ncbi:MAG: dTMP kinase [Maricaulaceae bacterium]|jgi:dTMP kinase
MSERLKGRFITFEGGEGAGKTTQARRLAAKLIETRGEQVLVTREPGGSLIGNAIRALLVSRAASEAELEDRIDALEMLHERAAEGSAAESLLTAYQSLVLAPGHIRSPMTEALLHFAARAEHWEFALKPMLQAYPWVICDRFTDSTMAYQGYAGGKERPGVGRETIEALANVAIPGVKPDLTLVMDIEPGAGLARATARRADASSYEMLDLSYHERVREGFLDIARRDPERCRLIDAAADEDAVAAAVWREVESFLETLPAAS